MATFVAVAAEGDERRERDGAGGDGAGAQAATTRIRLAGTQDVVAVAEMADGSFAAVSKTVKVTIGGCGG